MLTIDEIKNISFRKATLSGGYRAEDVDAFIDEVIASFEQLKKEKTNLVHKIDILATRVEQYKSDEETVRNALLASQKVSDACIREAKEKAAKIVRDAENKAQALLVDANKMTAIEKENYLQLQSDAVALRNELIELYRNHIKAIDDLPTAADLEDSKKTLDEKYPTEDIKEEPAHEEIESHSEEQTEDKTVAEDIAEEKFSVKSEPAPKRSGKFAHLKFGDNYDVSAD